MQNQKKKRQQHVKLTTTNVNICSAEILNAYGYSHAFMYLAFMAMLEKGTPAPIPN